MILFVRRGGYPIDLTISSCSCTQNLYFLSELHQIKKSSDANNTMMLLSKLIKGGVKVGMLDSWHEVDTKKPYLIGTHRKIMLVDDKWLLTGGRNLEDGYTISEGQQDEHKFYDADVVLTGNFSDTTRLLFDELWAKSRPVDKVCQASSTKKTASSLAVVSGWVFPNDSDEQHQRRSSFFMTHRSSQVSAFDEAGAHSSTLSKSMYTVNSSFFGRASTFAFHMEAIDDNSSSEVSLYQLDHKGGRTDGKDIILSTLLFLVATAKSRIDIMFGYLQLFPVLEEALKQALDRGVEVRVFTNSKDTCDLAFMNNIFQQAFCSLLEMGAKVYVPSESSAKNLCIHTKMLLVDSRALLVGSWNAIGVSVLYEEEFSTVLLGDEESATFQRVEMFYDELVEGGYFSQMLEPPPKFSYPFIVKMFMSKWGRRMFEKGF